MSKSFVTSLELQDIPLWRKTKKKSHLVSFVFEITARCTQNCRHCYINLPANDQEARDKELTLDEIEHIANQAVASGALWCLLTGGDPLIRPDFADIYLLLKRKGLLVSVFTTATLVNKEHITLFLKYPPRDIEVTVYGVTKETYERVTRCPGSYRNFRRGLDMLLSSGIKVRLKAMALRSNVHEIAEISSFCRKRTKDYYRFDPQLHLRFDGDPKRNDEIRSERLRPEEIVALEQSDPDRLTSLEQACATLIEPDPVSWEKCQACSKQEGCERFASLYHLFRCGVGNSSCNIGYDGTLRLCSSLCAPNTTGDLLRSNLKEVWETLHSRIRAMRTEQPTLLKTCCSCPHLNLCSWCPAHAQLETGNLEGATPYFCAVAHARANMLIKQHKINA